MDDIEKRRARDRQNYRDKVELAKLSELNPYKKAYDTNRVKPEYVTERITTVTENEHQGDRYLKPLYGCILPNGTPLVFSSHNPFTHAVVWLGSDGILASVGANRPAKQGETPFYPVPCLNLQKAQKVADFRNKKYGDQLRVTAAEIEELGGDISNYKIVPIQPRYNIGKYKRSHIPKETLYWVYGAFHVVELKPLERWDLTEHDEDN